MEAGKVSAGGAKRGISLLQSKEDDLTGYSLASSSWDAAEVEALKRVIESNQYTMGAEVHSYEQRFADELGSRYAVMTSSGSAANLLMTASMFYTKDETRRLARGDEVIVPAIAWSTSYFPLQQYGLKLIFVDIDRETLNFDLVQLRNAINENTKAVLAVNLLGNPNDFTAINEMLMGTSAVLLEDNCESLGATLSGRSAGTFGLMGTFSSFFSHHISTMEGGCVVTDDEELYHIMLAIRAHGWTRDLPRRNLVSGDKHSDPFHEAFKFVLPGYNLRPLEMSGAAGKEQLKKLPSFLKHRRDNAKYLRNALSGVKGVSLQKEIGDSSWFGFSLVVEQDAGFTRGDLVLAFSDNKIECRPIVTGNFLKNKEVLTYFDYEVFDHVPNAEYVDRNGLFVGNHHYSIEKEIDLLATTLHGLG
jgi:dTDP-4-amino-4,6-dideoxygalactose transaminase